MPIPAGAKVEEVRIDPFMMGWNCWSQRACMNILPVIFAPLAAVFLSGCATVPKYVGAFQGTLLATVLVDQEGKRFGAAQIEILSATFLHKRPDRSVIGTRPLLVNMRYECLPSPVLAGERVELRGTLESRRPLNPENHALAVETVPPNNATSVVYILKICSSTTQVGRSRTHP